jgi:hypothetical protein
MDILKEKRKGQQKNSWMKFSLKLAVFLLIPTILCGVIFVAVGYYGIGTGGYFKRFETPDEVEVFLYDNLEQNESTSDDIFAFMNEYVSANDCRTSSLNTFVYNRQGKVDSYIGCLTETISALAYGGTWYYSIRFYFYEDGSLAYIEVEQFCSCL